MPLISVRRVDSAPVVNPYMFLYPHLTQGPPAIQVAVDQQVWMMTLEQTQHYIDIADIQRQITAASGTHFGVSISDTGVISPEGARRLIVEIQKAMGSG